MVVRKGCQVRSGSRQARRASQPDRKPLHYQSRDLVPTWAFTTRLRPVARSWIQPIAPRRRRPIQDRRPARLPRSGIASSRRASPPACRHPGKAGPRRPCSNGKEGHRPTRSPTSRDPVPGRPARRPRRRDRFDRSAAGSSHPEGGHRRPRAVRRSAAPFGTPTARTRRLVAARRAAARMCNGHP